MKKIVSILLSCVMLASMFAIVASAEETLELISKASEWETLVVEEDTSVGLVAEAPEGWLDGSDSAEWTTAQAPFSAKNWAKDIVNTKFDCQYFSAFLRTTFTVEYAAEVNALTMSVIYDEDPVVYINGVEVWGATGYKDSSYTTVDLTSAKSALKDGENTVCVFFCNVNGGALFDMSLSASVGELDLIDSEGKAIVQSVTTTGFANFGAINAPENVLDMNQSTVTGSGFNSAVEQSVTLNFRGAVAVSEIFVQCKDEGTTTNADGTRGTYDIYCCKGGVEEKVGTLNAVTGTDGGATLTLSAPVEADSVKIVITSWQGDCWACVADVSVSATEIAPIVPPPVTADYTVALVVVAAVALMGCAVVAVSSKKSACSD